MRVTIPNLLTLFRMGLVPLFIIALLDERPWRALVIFLVAGLTDGLDGLIARFWNQRSLLGAYLDPIADKLLMTAGFVMLALPFAGEGLRIPVWVAVLVIARDVLILIICLVLYLALGVWRFEPSLLGKATTAFQVLTVLLALVSRIRPAIEPFATGVLYWTVALTVTSAFFYLLRTARAETLARDAAPPPSTPAPDP